MKMVHELGHYFLVRMRSNRWLIFGKNKVKAFDKAKHFKGRIVVPMTVYSKERFIKASSFRCKLNGFHNDVWVVISYMDSLPDPMILITNKPLSKKEEIAQAVYRYSSRWRIEEYFRFKKVELGFENFRVKSLDSINNLTFSLDIAIMLLAVIVEEGSPYLYGKLISHAKTIKDSVSIEFYRILSGISSIFSTNKKGVKNYKPVERRKPRQLTLFKIQDFD